MKDIMTGMDQALTVYILAVSLLTWILFGLDKWKAIHRQRFGCILKVLRKCRKITCLFVQFVRQLKIEK